jgi:hypothetical protein
MKETNSLPELIIEAERAEKQYVYQIPFCRLGWR